eukprot:1902085-Amphidinium_carterae.5
MLLLPQESCACCLQADDYESDGSLELEGESSTLLSMDHPLAEQPEQTSTAWAAMLKWVWGQKGAALPTSTVIVETGCTGTGSPTIGLKTDALVWNASLELFTLQLHIGKVGVVSMHFLALVRFSTYPSVSGSPRTRRNAPGNGVKPMEWENTCTQTWRQWWLGMEVTAGAVSTRMRSAFRIAELDLLTSKHTVSLLGSRALLSRFRGLPVGPQGHGDLTSPVHRILFLPLYKSTCPNLVDGTLQSFLTVESQLT